MHSNLQVTQVRHGDIETVWRARREDLLRSTNGQWKLAKRKVILLGSVIPRTLAYSCRRTTALPGRKRWNA